MRLLLAEDERELSEALTVILKHNHYSVDAVDNGRDALAYLESQEYDGAILDIMMPGMDGITVLKKIREQGISTPVLMLTARSGVDDRVDGLDAGADDYLGKPFAMKELLARIRAMLRRQTREVPTALQAGNVTLDRAAFEQSSPYGKFRLTNKEYQLMELLMVNLGQIIPTERFLEKIWGYDSSVEVNVVWVYISYLRKKLGALKATVFIRAVRNQGYFLEERS